MKKNLSVLLFSFVCFLTFSISCNPTPSATYICQYCGEENTNPQNFSPECKNAPQVRTENSSAGNHSIKLKNNCANVIEYLWKCSKCGFVANSGAQKTKPTGIMDYPYPNCDSHFFLDYKTQVNVICEQID